jgi:hypothetical protein
MFNITSVLRVLVTVHAIYYFLVGFQFHKNHFFFNTCICTPTFRTTRTSSCAVSETRHANLALEQHAALTTISMITQVTSGEWRVTVNKQLIVPPPPTQSTDCKPNCNAEHCLSGRFNVPRSILTYLPICFI